MSHDQLSRDILPKHPNRQWALECLKPYNLTEADFDQESQRLAKRFRAMPSPADVVHSLFIQMQREAAKKGNFGELHQIRRSYAWVLFQIGRPHHHVLRQAHIAELQSCKVSGVVKGVRVSVAENACSVCKALAGRVFTLHEALREPPLPVTNCQGDRVRGERQAWCRCSFDEILDEGILEELEEIGEKDGGKEPVVATVETSAVVHSNHRTEGRSSRISGLMKVLFLGFMVPIILLDQVVFPFRHRTSDSLVSFLSFSVLFGCWVLTWLWIRRK